MTGSQLQKEGYYSAAIIKADISSPNFDGHITYDALDDGSPNGGAGISVFAMGFRNPYGIAMVGSDTRLRRNLISQTAFKWRVVWY